MAQSSYIPSNNGLQSYIDAAPSYELAPIGIASMQDQAQKLAEMGRNGDIYVVHAAEGETVIPMEVLEANPQIKALLFNQMTEMGLDPQRYVVGDKLNSLNPVTGMPEFFFKSIFKGIKKAVKSVVKVVKKIAPVVLPIAASVFGVPFLPTAFFGPASMGAAALGSGIGTLIGGGSLKDAFKSALISGGTAGIFGGLKGAFKAPGGLTGPNAWSGAKSGFAKALYNPAAATPGQVLKHLVSGPGTTGQNIFDVVTGDVQAPTSTAPVQISPLPEPELPAIRTPISTTDLSAISPSNVDVNRMINPDIGYPSELNLAGGDLAGGQFGASRAVDVPSSRISIGSGWDIAGAPPSRTGELYTLKPNEEWSMVGRSAAQGPIVKEKGFSLGTGEGPWGLPGTGNKLVDTALYGGGAYLGADALGAFKRTEQEKIGPEDAPLGLQVSQPIDLAAADEAEIDVTAPNVVAGGYQPPAPVQVSNYEDFLPPNQFAAQGGSIEYPRRELLVEGPGTEKSDDIPAMLSDGEFVINSKAVRGADPSGRGNRYAGAQNLYNLMRNFEMRA